jgi:hypothetical protein
MKHIAGVFSTQAQADQAITELMRAGFEQSDISLLVSEKVRNSLFPAVPTYSSSSAQEETGNRAVRGGAAGALIGGALGALIGGLATVGSIAVPGSGVLAAGPIVGALSGAGAGAATGGLAGALISAGFSPDDAKRYEEEINRGNAVVSVDVEDKRVTEARIILQRNEGTAKVA